jgi:diguanylate cyclase (GGDEF)-like protein
MVLISIRRQMDESEHFATCFAALLKAFLGLTTAVPRTALPANSELSTQCKQNLERATAPLEDYAAVQAIDEAGKIALQQIEQICRSNKAAMEERDVAVKDVVAMVAKAISGIKGNGERHKSNLSKLADGFDALSRVQDPTELRRRLRDDAGMLRQSVEEMRRDNEASIRQFESQITDFEQRLEMARKESGIDRLTGLGSRREAERHLQKMGSRERPVCLLLFDIEGFGEINKQHGTLFGDQLLQALAHLLRTEFSEEGTVFRWAADEFLVIAEGLPPAGVERCRDIRHSFNCCKYVAVKSGAKVTLSADVAFGVAQYIRGESVELLYHRAHETLEHSLESLRR